ncbi:MAG: glycosyltransferase [Anaerolineales bacterium]
MSKSLRVCYFGTYRAAYSRNVNMIEGLRRAGVEVIECHVPLWQGIEDRVAATKGGWKHPAFWGRVMRTYLQLLAKFRQVKDFDVLVVGYPGQFDVFLARLLAWARRKPLVWDVFMSIYLIAWERGLEKNSRLTVETLRRLEWLALRVPDLLVQDTAEYVDWLVKTHSVSPDRFRLVPTGADDRVFQPEDPEARTLRLRKPFAQGATTLLDLQHPERSGNEPDSVNDLSPAQSKDAAQGAPDGIVPTPFRVVYFGTFIPNHGVGKIIDAARELAPEPMQFDMIGDGPERAAAEASVRAWGVKNVAFLGWMEHEALARHVRAADVCLGAFGETPQSLMTVQNKIFTGLALGVPVLTGDGPAVRRTFRHGEHVYLCKRTGKGLAEALRVLKADAALRERLGQEGYRVFRAQFDLQHLGEVFAKILREVVSGRG